jgi:hypothetical protein
MSFAARVMSFFDLCGDPTQGPIRVDGELHPLRDVAGKLASIPLQSERDLFDVLANRVITCAIHAERSRDLLGPLGEVAELLSIAFLLDDVGARFPPAPNLFHMLSANIAFSAVRIDCARADRARRPRPMRADLLVMLDRVDMRD